MERVRERLPFAFPNKDRIVELMVSIEGRRDSFCYGAERKVEDIRAVLLAFQELRDIFRSMGVAET